MNNRTETQTVTLGLRKYLGQFEMVGERQGKGWLEELAKQLIDGDDVTLSLNPQQSVTLRLTDSHLVGDL